MASEATVPASASQEAASKPEFKPQYGSDRLLVKDRMSSLTEFAKASSANEPAAPHKRTEAWGIRNWCISDSTITRGKAAGSWVSSNVRVQRCSRSAMATFSWLLRIISMMRISSPLMRSRSISICRSCSDTARWPCGLVSCTLDSRSAWRSKKAGLLAR